VNLSIKNVPPQVVAKLKSRARRNHRSLQGELLAIAERAANEPGAADTDEREQDIQHIVGLMKAGLRLGGRRFTRDEMHER
jgi:plasmid stability protein